MEQNTLVVNKQLKFSRFNTIFLTAAYITAEPVQETIRGRHHEKIKRFNKIEHYEQFCITGLAR